MATYDLTSARVAVIWKLWECEDPSGRRNCIRATSLQGSKMQVKPNLDVPTVLKLERSKPKLRKYVLFIVSLKYVRNFHGLNIKLKTLYNESQWSVKNESGEVKMKYLK